MSRLLVNHSWSSIWLATVNGPMSWFVDSYVTTWVMRFTIWACKKGPHQWCFSLGPFPQPRIALKIEGLNCSHLILTANQSKSRVYHDRSLNWIFKSTVALSLWLTLNYTWTPCKNNDPSAAQKWQCSLVEVEALLMRPTDAGNIY